MGRGGAAAYNRALRKYQEQQKEEVREKKPVVTSPEVSPVTPMAGNVKPEKEETPPPAPILPPPEYSDASSVRPGEGQNVSGVTDDQPQITPPSQLSSVPQSVQRQASYDQPSGGGVQAPVILPKKRQQMSGGGSGGQIVPLGSGNVLNSYYKSQLLGFLYKQG